MVIILDIDEMMTRIYENSDKSKRETSALAEYVDVRNQYGDNSQEEKQLYGILINIFPEIQQYRELIRSLDADFAAGEFQLLPGDEEIVEAALRKAGLNN